MGNKHYEKKERLAHLKKQKSGDLGATEYCHQNNIPLSTFNSWRKRFGENFVSRGRPSFLKIELPSRIDSTVSILLPNSLSIKLDPNIDKKMLKELLETLTDIKPC
jgi:hypothetical protein